MGKYMKKSKTTGKIGVMEVTEPTSMGVRTRAAKTLALKRLNSSASDSALPDDSSCYLQLRSRRLEKPSSLIEPRQQPPRPRVRKSGIKEPRVDSVNSVDSVPVAQTCNGDECFDNSASAQVSGDNSLDFESRHSTRESAPCNFVEDHEIMVTPGSSTRSMRTPTKEYTRDRDSTIPTTSELEEFFAFAEQQQQRLFIEKYNFDIVNDVPLSGRYEWVQVTP
ncbi:PREDICTED: cyclin-dependent kinase inhibitor 3-like [Camelina sativa]|uniref:Cyclin-dependent kinase inhibitor n=1 Tax=Camelina sativa TaxID=90675 RepID=A0ABM0UDT3_CAMSA|nr:PREDICTED: cyclin-dependent kinase inhibitor 3-like [Camelina sativa]